MTNIEVLTEIAIIYDIPYHVEEYKGNYVFIFNVDCKDILPYLQGYGSYIDTVPYGSTDLGFDKVAGGRTEAVNFYLEVYDLLCKLMKDKANIITFGDFQFLAGVYNAIPKKCGTFSAWEKTRVSNFPNANNMPLGILEFILRLRNKENGVFNPQKIEGKPYKKKNGSRPTSKHFDNLERIENINDGYRLCTNLYYYPSTNGNIHPTAKPVKLLQRLVLEYSNKNDLVLDTFCGGGSTLQACIIEGRSAIGIEKDPIYFAESVKQVKRTIENLNNSFLGELTHE